MTAPYDAIVIGAGVNGLTAASYLAMAGQRVVVLDAQERPGGLSAARNFSGATHALYALDPSVIRELKINRRGLKFVLRDMPLVGLRSDGRHLILNRDTYASARNLAVHSQADAAAWAEFRREWFALARAMRSLWWRAGPLKTESVARDPRLLPFARMGAGAWLDSWFESDALKATLGFDAHALSPLAAGSALLLLWRAAQEMCGLQGATAFPSGGFHTVVDAFAEAARAAGVEQRLRATVADILVDREGAVMGVALDTGETIAARRVLSSLSRERSLSYASVRAALDFGEATETERRHAGTQMAHVGLVLDAEPKISGGDIPMRGRIVLVERLESLTLAHAAAAAGYLPQELTMEVVLPVGADPTRASEGRHLVSVLVGPLPATVEGGWRNAKALLAAKVIAALSRHMPGLTTHLVGVEVLSPEDVRETCGADDAFGGRVDAGRLMADWRSRVRTPIPGLILCGAAADPVGAVSGRGGRMAACFAFEQDGKK